MMVGNFITELFGEEGILLNTEEVIALDTGFIETDKLQERFESLVRRLKDGA